jgi:hypothetical protein
LRAALVRSLPVLGSMTFDSALCTLASFTDMLEV